MKKTYEAPIAEKLEFDYKRVVAASGKTDTVDDMANTCGGSDTPSSQDLFGTIHEQWCHGG